MAECDRREANLKGCTCTYDCDKRGNCCACVAYHRGLGQIPGCFFPAAAERTYDRSVTALIRARGGR